MTALTPRRRELLHVIHDYMARTGVCPTRTQLGAMVGIKPFAVDALVNALLDAGFLARTKGQPRSLQVITLPVAGLTAAEWTWCVANPGRVRAMMAVTNAIASGAVTGAGPSGDAGGRA